MNSSVESIAPSTSKQTETVHSKSFSKHSIQKKKEIFKRKTQFPFKRRSRRLFVSKTAASFKRHLNVDSDSQEKEASNKIEPNKRRKNSRKGFDKKFKVKDR